MGTFVGWSRPWPFCSFCKDGGRWGTAVNHVRNYGVVWRTAVFLSLPFIQPRQPVLSFARELLVVGHGRGGLLGERPICLA
ncbi:MAG: hypothetical protein KJ069_30985 [Anaerolineae bacterium]|nr:hypothetical protein [Anaerolineae bacterium]